jgi:plasminogen activator inhibitor 1 RNA-binding protein
VQAPGGAPGGGLEGEQRREKRVYERRSGTGRGREIKKGGGGRGNWGKDTDAAEETGEQPVEGEKTAPVTTTEGGEPAAAATAAKTEGEGKAEEQQQQPAKEEEEEDNTMTLDEYLKKKSEKTLNISLPPPRKAGEGQQNPEWSKFVQLQRDDEEDTKKPGSKKDDQKKAQKDQTKKETAVSIDAVFKVQDESPKRQPRRERGENNNNARGGAGGERKGAGRGGAGRGRGGPRNPTPNMDEKNFPALATTKA